MQKAKPIIYLASPYGFTDAGRDFMKNSMIPSIKKAVSVILNPWDGFDSASQEIERINLLKDTGKRKEQLKALNRKIGQINEDFIRKAEIIVAVLDGPDIDSGVAAEIGYAYALKKKIIGYRSDFRLTGDNSAAFVNIQVEYFVNKSGGCTVRKISDLVQALKEVRKAFVTPQ